MVIWLQKVILKEKVIEDVFGCVCVGGGGGPWVCFGKTDGFVDSVCWLKKQMNTNGAS